MFHFDRGLFLTRAQLAVDVRRRQPRGFISHAHTDHTAPHQLALCTPQTAKLYQHRYGRRDVLEMPYRVPLEWGGVRLTTFPAGHCLGAAMLLAEDEGQSLLYTGDFKLADSATCESAELPRAEILVIESTFGDPRYRFRPRADLVRELVEIAGSAIADGAVPVIEAYVLGKAQEVTRLLTAAGIPVLQHRDIFAVSRVYQECGVDLGHVAPLIDNQAAGYAVVVPPRFHRGPSLPGIQRQVRIAVTGWAIQPGARYRLGVDHAIPLSDHADYDDLFVAVERVSPRTVYCTHGPESFVDRLREAGWDARTLRPAVPADSLDPSSRLQPRTTSPQPLIPVSRPLFE